MSKDSKKHSHTCSSCSNKEDHRILGERLEIFDFDPLVGAGMPLWLENGHTLKEVIRQYVNSVQARHGIKMVSTPVLGRKELYKTSGHWDHYQENMFPTLKLDESDDYVLRPMTCPHHILLYKKTNHHEKHLPIAFGENANLYRYECSGGLMGLERTRCMELIDTHIFCSKSTLAQSLQKAINIINEVKEAFDIQYDHIVLAVRDSSKDKFYNDDQLWKTTEQILKEFLEDQKISFEIGEGDAAFYGPKIDFQIRTHMNKVLTISTIQLDFLLPQRFELSYLTGESGDKEIPIMIHLGIIGTLERFTSYLLERDGGWLPFWLSPTQIAIIPIDPSKHMEAAQKLFNFFNQMGIRVSMEDEHETLSKRMAKIINKRVYGQIVVGDKEVDLIEQLTQTATNVHEKAEEKWSQIISLIRHSRGDRKNITDRTHPKGHPDLLKWSFYNK